MKIRLPLRAQARRSRTWVARLLTLSAIAATMALPPRAGAVDLGSAGSFGVLANTTVTSAGATIINGDLGVTPGTAVGGSPIVNGTIYTGANAVAEQAMADATSAYATLAGETATHNLSGFDLGGMTLTSGIYQFDTSAALTGILTLDAQGVSGAEFDFLIGSTFTSLSAASIVLENGALAGNVFFQIGSSATLGSLSSLAGSFLASQSITVQSGVVIQGRVIALNGAVTLDSNIISVPEPSTWALLGTGALILMTGYRRRVS